MTTINFSMLLFRSILCAGLNIFVCLNLAEAQISSVATTPSFVPDFNRKPLEGINTYDLLLIQKHISGTEPLTSPYKMIAADANKSGSITTFDIVELRRLILGITQTLPITNTTWRFVDESFIFPNPTNPFASAFPENITVNTNSGGNFNGRNFVAIKVGDVNNSVIPNKPGAPLPKMPLSWPIVPARSGEYVTVPVTYSGRSALEAIQIGLRFDPALWAFTGMTSGDLPSWTDQNFNLEQVSEGKIRTLWLPMYADEEPTAIHPGTILFYLTFRALSTQPDQPIGLELDDQLLQNMAWMPDGAERLLTHQSPTQSRTDEPVLDAKDALVVQCQPNPATDIAYLEVNTTQSGKLHTAIFDAKGIRVSAQANMMVAGQSQRISYDVKSLPAGVYVWKARMGKENRQGHLIVAH